MQYPQMFRLEQHRQMVRSLILAGMLVCVPQAQRTPRSDLDQTARESFQRFAQVYAIVEQNYATPVDA